MIQLVNIVNRTGQPIMVGDQYLFPHDTRWVNRTHWELALAAIGGKGLDALGDLPQSFQEAASTTLGEGSNLDESGSAFTQTLTIQGLDGEETVIVIEVDTEEVIEVEGVGFIEVEVETAEPEEPVQPPKRHGKKHSPRAPLKEA